MVTADVAKYPSLSGKRMLRDWYSSQNIITANECAIALGLVMKKGPCYAEICKWPDEIRRHVINWAIREHFYASDNNVVRLQEPEILKQKAP